MKNFNFELAKQIMEHYKLTGVMLTHPEDQEEPVYIDYVNPQGSSRYLALNDKWVKAYTPGIPTAWEHIARRDDWVYNLVHLLSNQYGHL